MFSPSLTPMDIAGRNALITGGAHRLGRALTLALSEAGADVFIHYKNSSEAAETTASEARAAGREAATGSADLGDPATGGILIEMATAALGPISILVNSASGFPTDSLESIRIEDWHRAHDLTLASPVFLTQAFAAALPSDMEGAVVNITDVHTKTPYRNHFSYTVAKGGLDTFTRAAALALAPRIRVNAVALGLILPPAGEDQAYVEALAEGLPLAKVGGTDPVVSATIALIQNPFITGEIVRTDGGSHLVSPQ